ncbi:MAG: type I glyceraldehyde-3-phosphate dehydrogenase [Candidatus Cloacimonetes bacterium]|nr:type I glyceraldehyde-3-phosphate dehydrogenase [Candidatus Cloacimonadota bacterium]MCF7814666.1 type I glyceraldehyde-3-phosphate dehydrogenase [Candidatus Cloacimonadota bacterium]MCF7869335.1 type I glyceraldehyde-3-phosphate dehydrogenase [Candidatus Cloacimonadota bacterium]MCF7884548.1 type I glyceraldehyde-3-phosphate dehydrogenase [Candidatus Cloacimonadota bacterium]
MSIKIGINGFGRIGKMVFRLAIQDPEIEIVHVNDKMDIELLHHLIKYDSVHGRFITDAKIENDSLIFNDKKILITHFDKPENIPWQKQKADIIVESSGIFKTRKQMEGHLKQGAEKVILSCPSEDETIDRTVIMGINHNELSNSDKIISNSSCTANCVTILLKILHDEFGIQKAFMNTVHPFTNNQKLQDGFHPDFRRARSALNNIIPTTSSAVVNIPFVMPEMKGIFDGFATRVPVSDCSFVELTAHLASKVTVPQINGTFMAYALGKFKDYLEYCEDPIVSKDVNSNYHSAIFDSLSTKVLGNDLIQVLAWYDNESGYSARMIDLIKYFARL